MASKDSRKQRIMEHVARSSGDYVTKAASNPTISSDRRQQIMDHIRLSKG
ncbi:MAG: hypothetical protein HC895_20570 [Leptolyngbyaceae cyanobacterium SM1_3_5]|nr:hypothetical protein [Leptolyngbyaceae cyanobacterium SM1_3_5]